MARELGYELTDGVCQGDGATNRAFKPIETFPERFEALLEEVAELGFDTLDLWTAHLSWAWATDAHIATARTLLAKQGLRVWAYTGYFGTSLEQFLQSCRIAKGLGASVMAGFSPAAVTPEGVRALRDAGLRLGYENHSEKSADEVVEVIGEADTDVLGVTVDTGWFTTQGADPVAVIRELGPRVFAVHLKDIRSAGGHETCPYGQGVVEIRGCVAALREAGYSGPLSMEHFPDRGDPRPGIAASVEYLKR